MQINFRTLVLASAAMAAVAMTSIPAMAATSGPVNLTVPFSFTVQGKTLPAGVYSVMRDDLGIHVKLENRETAQTFVWFVHYADTNPDRVVLRFEVDGQTHALQSIQCGHLETSRLTKKVKKGEDISPLIGVGQ